MKIPTLQSDRRHNRAATVADHGAIVMGSNVNGIGVIRSLGRLHITSGAIWADEHGDHALHSKYLRCSRRINHISDDTEISNALYELSDSLSKQRPVLIPTSDRYSQFLCRNADTLADRFRLNCAGVDLYDTFLDKWRTADICSRNAVPIPDTYCPTNQGELDRIVPTLPYPLIGKPRYTFDHRFPGKNVLFNDPAEVHRFFEKHPILGDVVLQQIIPSGDGDIFVIASYSSAQGTVQAMYSGRKIRQYLPDYGATCFGLSETQHDLEVVTRRFLDAIGYKGFAMVEFARHRVHGTPYFLELNTRTSWTNQLFADAGVDLTQIGYLDMIGTDFRTVLGEVQQQDDIYWLDFRRDFASYRLKRQQGQIKFIQWLSSIIRARSFAYWDFHDPKPFFVGCLWRVREIIEKRLLFLNRLRFHK